MCASQANGLIKEGNEVMLKTREFLFKFRYGDKGTLFLSGSDKDNHNNTIVLGLCPRGEDYSITNKMTDHDKCEILLEKCQICLFIVPITSLYSSL